MNCSEDAYKLLLRIILESYSNLEHTPGFRRYRLNVWRGFEEYYMDTLKELRGHGYIDHHYAAQSRDVRSWETLYIIVSDEYHDKFEAIKTWADL